MRELDCMAVQASVDEQLMNKFVEENERFILKCAGNITHRYINKSDDEWSLALLAFTEAIKSYKLDKGSFLSFAELIIRRRLTDHYRKQSKYNAEVSVNPSVFGADFEDDEDNLSINLAVVKQVTQTESNQLSLEIETANTAFASYGFSFFDLADCSPKAGKTKEACAKAVAYLLHNPVLINELHASKQLPLKIIEKNARVPRKILERHRKYIIAAIEILSGEYPCLAEYMRFIRKELDR